MNDKQARALSRLVEQLSRQLHAAAHTHDLYPAQWAALRYFANASVQHSTVVALARYQSTAIPPVSRTVATLIGKKLLHKVGRLPGQRTEIIAITPAGTALLSDDPLLQVERALLALTDQEFETAANVLEHLIRAVSMRGQNGDDFPAKA